MSTTDETADQLLALFRSGKDTLQIAELHSMPEARVSFLIYAARSRERGLPVMHEKRPDRRPPPPHFTLVAPATRSGS